MSNIGPHEGKLKLVVSVVCPLSIPRRKPKGDQGDYLLLSFEFFIASSKCLNLPGL